MHAAPSSPFLFTPGGDQAQADLCHRRERLEEAAAVVGRLAHDFGNVLTSILGFAELTLSQLRSDSDVMPYVTEMQRAAQQGAQFISELRLFSRRSAVQPRPASVAAVAAEEQSRAEPNWVPGCELRVGVLANLPHVAIDVDPLRQILSRLLDNAHEACVGKESLVSLTARVVDLTEADTHHLLGNVSPGPHVEITIADNGKGLSPVAQQCLFREMFFTTKPRHRGLGLAIVYGILHAYRGGLRIDPISDSGTVVRVVLPVAPVNAPTIPARVPQGRAADSKTTSGDKNFVTQTPNFDSPALVSSSR